MPKAALFMGSKSDFASLEGCVRVLKSFGIETTVRVASAHRTPQAVAEFAAGARANGYEVILAAAGKAAHLAGVIAGHTTLPVIGIPVKSSFMDGLDSLLSTVQMPTGIPVATVAIDGAANAALLAIEILAVSDEALAEKLRRARAAESQKVLEKNAGVEAEFNTPSVEKEG